MLRRWNLTVFSLTFNSLASLRLEVTPRTRSSSTSRSRSVRSCPSGCTLACVAQAAREPEIAFDPFAGDGLCRSPEIETWIKPARDAFDGHRHEAMPDLYLSDEDIRALAEHPLVELGSHTRNHYPLHRVSHETIEAEVVLAHEELTERYGEAIDGFCLPFGYRHHLTENVVRYIRKVDESVVSAYGGRMGAHSVHGVPEIRRIGAWGNLGVLWHQLRYEP